MPTENIIEPHWFEVWFNTPYYHILYKHRDDKEAHRFIDNLIQKYSIFPANKVLDVACGKGRFAKYISQKGISVVGIDISPVNIDEALQHTNDHLDFVKGDMRYMEFDEQFDFVLNMFTSFGYFTCDGDNILSIRSMEKALKDHGILIIDFFNAEKVISQLPTSETLIIEGIEFHIEKTFSEGYILKNISFIDNDEHFYFQEKVQALTREKFIGYFNEAGLKTINIYGDYDFNEWKKESDRTIFVLAKTNHLNEIL